MTINLHQISLTHSSLNTVLLFFTKDCETFFIDALAKRMNCAAYWLIQFKII